MPQLRRALDLADSSADPRRLFWAGIAALVLGDDEQALRCFGQETAQARSEGSVAMVAQALTMLSASEFLRGHGASARATATEGLALAQATGQGNIACLHLAVLARVAASFGTEDETRSLVAQYYQATVNRGLPPIEHMITVALGEMELARGNAERALAHLSEVAAAGLGSAIRSSACMPSRATPKPASAQASRTWPPPRQRASANGRPPPDRRPALPCRPASSRCWPPPTPPAPTSPKRSVSISPRRGHSTGRGPNCSTENGCAADANDSAHASTCVPPWTCSSGWARAPGPSGPAPSCEQPARQHARASQAPPSRTTPQELQVARFIAAGASTRQAASQMFLSPRTIDAHLRSIYAKLGITSRTELRAADLDQITQDAAQ